MYNFKGEKKKKTKVILKSIGATRLEKVGTGGNERLEKEALKLKRNGRRLIGNR